MNDYFLRVASQRTGGALMVATHNPPAFPAYTAEASGLADRARPTKINSPTAGANGARCDGRCFVEVNFTLRSVKVNLTLQVRRGRRRSPSPELTANL
jgi:hypothetical protein